MPTSYTAELMKNGENPKTFILRAVRAMGVAIEMRDDSLDKPIPERFEPSDYHIKALRSARNELARLKKFTKQEKINFGQARIDKSKQENEKYLKTDIQENKRLEDMTTEVMKWSRQAGAEYDSFRDFMLEQLKISRNHTEYYEKPREKQNPLDIYNQAIKSEEESIIYHTEEMDKELKRYKEKNKYLAGIRKSLEIY